MMKNTDITLTNFEAVIDHLGELDPKERATLEKETKGLGSDMVNFGRARMAIGERLVRIREILQPKGVFVRFLDEIRFDRKTAYNLMNGFENAKANLPEIYLLAAMSRGLDMMGTNEERPLGRFTEAVAALPPPKTQDPKKVHDYLDKVVQFRKEHYLQERTYSLDRIELECFRFVDSRVKRLPRSHKARKAFLDAHVGMLMTAMGISNRQSFEPIAIAEGVRAKRGRPRKVEEEEAA
jgi:hypothetical protein